ncbi:MAG: hypothetical protein HOI47_28650 [Candidatus Scalindua sp.]|nr:hypothetical protein [Candidatus Scalindua sp.]MBT6046880.1 hypothetical protein [Candidatus Scalindua sp.]MBT6230629.1 hypothetical protein [Candidatus Scalindua sp.]
MKEIQYIIYLTAESTDRLRVYAQKEKSIILEFVVQYEARISAKWRQIVRYDTAHGFAHKDIMKADGETIKLPLFFETYNLAFTYATIDLKANWKKYRENFEKGE